MQNYTFNVLYSMKNERQTQEQRNMAQLIRRNMITRVKPSGKMYSRKKKKSFLQD